MCFGIRTAVLVGPLDLQPRTNVEVHRWTPCVAALIVVLRVKQAIGILPVLPGFVQSVVVSSWVVKVHIGTYGGNQHDDKQGEGAKPPHPACVSVPLRNVDRNKTPTAAGRGRMATFVVVKKEYSSPLFNQLTVHSGETLAIDWDKWCVLSLCYRGVIIHLICWFSKMGWLWCRRILPDKVEQGFVPLNHLTPLMVSCKL